MLLPFLFIIERIKKDMKQIYLDNAATTSLSPEVLDAMMPYLTYEYGNPSSNYPLGVLARQAVGKARHTIAESIGAKDEQIYFTCGSTESINWVIHTMASRNASVAYSAIEHHAVTNAIKGMVNHAYEIPVDSDGVITASAVQEVIDRHDPDLVCTMWANNEIGTIEPISQISKVCEDRLLFVDATQAYMHIPVSVDDKHISYLCASAHKFHGPKGVGFLYASSDDLLSPFHFGGQQENNLRAGTENVAGIVGMAKAVEIAQKSLLNSVENEKRMIAHLWNLLRQKTPNLKLNGYDGFNGPSPYLTRLPNNLNICVEGVNGAELVELMGEMGVCISAGSACNSQDSEPSHVLKAIGLSDEDARNSVRITIGDDTTEQDLEEAAECFANCVNRLRLYKI